MLLKKFADYIELGGFARSMENRIRIKKELIGRDGLKSRWNSVETSAKTCTLEGETKCTDTKHKTLGVTGVLQENI